MIIFDGEKKICKNTQSQRDDRASAGGAPHRSRQIRYRFQYIMLIESNYFFSLLSVDYFKVNFLANINIVKKKHTYTHFIYKIRSHRFTQRDVVIVSSALIESTQCQVQRVCCVCVDFECFVLRCLRLLCLCL